MPPVSGLKQIKVQFNSYEKEIMLHWDVADYESSRRIATELRQAKTDGPLCWVVASMVGLTYEGDMEARVPRTGDMFLDATVTLSGFSRKLDHRAGQVPDMSVRQKIAIDQSKRKRKVSNDWDS